jgi:hypothetical protein
MRAGNVKPLQYAWQVPPHPALCMAGKMPGLASWN